LTLPLWTSIFLLSTCRQLVICSKSLPCLYSSFIWQNLYQIHAYEAQIYSYMEDLPPIALQRASMRHHSYDKATHSSLDNRSDASKSRSEKISVVQAFTCLHAPPEGCARQSRTSHGAPHAAMSSGSTRFPHRSTNLVPMVRSSPITPPLGIQHGATLRPKAPRVGFTR
jgi:hypothetical protein